MARARTQAQRYTVTPAQRGGEMATAGQIHPVERSVGVVGLTAIGLIHLLDAPGKASESPFMFWLYLALIAGCLGGATLLLRRNSQLGWLAAVLLSVTPFIGYVLSRSTGLPGAMGDIGNWTEPLGLASLFVEGCTCALGVAMLAQARKPGFHLVDAADLTTWAGGTSGQAR